MASNKSSQMLQTMVDFLFFLVRLNIESIIMWTILQIIYLFGSLLKQQKKKYVFHLHMSRKSCISKYSALDLTLQHNKTIVLEFICSMTKFILGGSVALSCPRAVDICCHLCNLS